MKKLSLLWIGCMLAGLQAMAQAPAISYPASSYTFTVGLAISPISPTNSGGGVTAPGSALVSTFAGSTQGYVNATGTAAKFYAPSNVAADAGGNVYVSDFGNQRIRKISPAGVVTFLAGSGTAGYADGTGTAAKFNGPSGVGVDGSGNVYVADFNNSRIRKITASGVVTTLAGSGSVSSVDGTGTAASFWGPTGLAVDASGNLYVADLNGNKIRKVTPAGLVTTLAGSGTAGFTDGTGAAATFKNPTSVALDGSGNVYVVEQGNHCVRKITPAGVVTTIAGTGTAGYADGTGTAASFNGPTGIAVNGSGMVYVADYFNNRIRQITPAGVVTTLAGSGSAGFANGAGTAASFNGPSDVALDGSGNLFVCDYENNRIRKIVISGGYTVSPALPTGLSLNATTGTISGTPSAVTAATNYIVTATNASGSSSFTLSIAIASNAGTTGPDNVFIGSASPMTTFCQGTPITINFSASGFNSGNVFTAQLSNASGSFASPVNIGTLTSTSGGMMGATIPAAQAAGTGYRIRIVASSPAITGPDNGTNLTVIAMPTTAQVTMSPGGTQNICAGSSVTLSVPNTAGFTYQWYVGGVAIAGATASSYTTGATGSYTCLVINSAGCSRLSAAKAVVVKALPTANISPAASQNLCGAVTSVNFSVNATTGATYQWMKDGVAISGATATTYTATTAGSYSVMVTGSTGCSATSATVVVTANCSVAITNTGTQTVCAGGSVSVNFSAAGFDAGNVFTLQLSDVSGNFTSVVNIGTLAATSGGTITGTIPAWAPEANGYKLRILTSSPATTGDPSPLTLQVRTALVNDQNLCAVSVDSATGKNKLIWNKPVTTSIDSFVFYRKDSMAVWQRIGAQSYSAFSTWIDFNSMPKVRAHRYYITAKNGCGETGMSTIHKTMHLTINKGTDNATWNLIWNGYEGTPHTYYNIYRGTLPGSMALLSTIEAFASNSFTDFNAPATGAVYYMVTVADAPACAPLRPTAGTGNGEEIASNIASGGVEAFAGDRLDMNVYPNPSNAAGTLLIQGSTPDEQYAVRVLDVTGRLVESVSVAAGQGTSFGQGLMPGIYTVEAVGNDGKRVVKRWIKQ